MDILFGVLAILPIFAIILESLSEYFSKPPFRLELKRGKPIKFPDLCAMTGEPTIASDNEAIYDVMWFFNFIRITEVTLPLTDKGYKLYKKSSPLSLKIIRAGLIALRDIHIYVALIFGMMWVPIAAFFCGYIAIIDLILRRKFPIKIHYVKSVDYEITEIVFSVSCKRFAEEFLRVNFGG
jgi:hypothetical protein